MERFGITVSGQLLEMIRFAAVGIALGVWYDVFRLIRLLTRPAAWHIFLQDVLFFASAAAATLLASLPISSGRVRVFHLLALVVGFVCYYHTVGRLVYQTARLIVAGIEKVAACLARIFGRITAGISPIYRRWGRAVRNSVKKVLQNCKNHLQPSHKV